MISRKTTKIATLFAILSIAGFFIYQGFAGPMKINMPETNPVRLNSGLVGYWTFDGQDTNWNTQTANDKSGQGNNGTITNMATTTAPVPGVIGQALYFDGSDDYVNSGTKFFTSKSQNFSASLWVKPAITQFAFIISEITSSNTDGWKIRWDTGGAITFYIEATDAGDCSSGLTHNLMQLTTTEAFNINQWHHILVTINGTSGSLISSNVNIYVDGINRSVSAIGFLGASCVMNNQTNTRIGTPVATTNRFNGSIDEVRVYNRAISASEITELYQEGQTKINASQANKLTSGLVGYWTFDGGDTNIGANTTSDRSGNGYTGTLSGTTKPSQAIGKIGQGLSFDGSTSYVNTNQDPAFDLTSDLTISAWIYAKASAAGIIFSKYDGGTLSTFQFQVLTGLKLFMLHASADYSDYLSTTDSFSQNQWHHAVVVRNSSNSKVTFYVDGNADSGGPLTYTPGAVGLNGYTAKIGTRGNPGAYFNGNIDEVRVYNRAISASEITELYQEGQTKINASQANKLASGLVGYWTMDGGDTNWTSSTAGTETNRGSAGGTGTLTNMSQSTTPAIGKIGQALNFNGSTSYVNLNDGVPGTAYDFQRNELFSAFTWIEGSASGETVILSKRSSSGYGWFMKKTSGNLLRFSMTDSNGDIIAKNSINTLSNGEWYHVGFTYNGNGSYSGIKLYINGNEISTSDNGATISASISYSVYTVIGATAGGTEEFFNGLIDEVRVYNRALSPSEVTELYNMGR